MMAVAKKHEPKKGSARQLAKAVDTMLQRGACYMDDHRGYARWVNLVRCEIREAEPKHLLAMPNAQVHTVMHREREKAAGLLNSEMNRLWRVHRRDEYMVGPVDSHLSLDIFTSGYLVWVCYLPVRPGDVDRRFLRLEQNLYDCSLNTGDADWLCDLAASLNHGRQLRLGTAAGGAILKA